jgi:hypothetical protein
MRLFQNPVGFETTSWKSGHMPAFPCKSKVAVPKTEVLEQPQITTIRDLPVNEREFIS